MSKRDLELIHIMSRLGYDYDDNRKEFFLDSTLKCMEMRQRIPLSEARKIIYKNTGTEFRRL